jgi:DNA-binding PadR family transcriptional regulator
MKRELMIGTLQFRVLRDVQENPADSYLGGIYRRIHIRTAGQASLGSVATALSRLKDKGMVKVRETQPRWGSRPRTLYEVLPKGKEAMRVTEQEWKKVFSVSGK